MKSVEEKGNWKGWEYETSNGLHMHLSKRHFFLDGEDMPVCGVNIPSWVTPSTREGDAPCRRCEKWIDKTDGIRVSNAW